ncbi:HIRA-interacting protein 3 isoform X2 [Mauremys reevesii]|uniref:HIRA-interacting protein 3 isoform X2 n=1 Tax=Mauremys reevesii TaxID=260615 RepID=UPI00193FC58D|nr:HIRA-interacting protein 3 isoform X2 [Mauremys reevesii]
MAAEQEMRDFTRGLFQGSPDLRVLTLAMVRRKYLAHVGRESLGREEKELLKELQLDDSSSEGGSPSPKSPWEAPQAEAQKRPHSSSESSGGPEDTARKKHRLDQGSEASSDGEDSGIDSRKPKPAPAEEDAGKSKPMGSCEDEGDSGAEDTPDRGGTSRESDSEWAARKEGRRGAEAQEQLGKKRAREAERRGDCGEQKGKANGGITAQTQEESGSEWPVEGEECKRQKQTGKSKRRRDREEEEGDSEKKARGEEGGSAAQVDEKGQGRKGAGQKGGRKAGRWSDSEEEENKEKVKAQREEESGSEAEEGRSRRPGMKKVERRSDSEAEEVGSRKKRTKAQSEEESGSEEEEGASRKETGKKGRRKAERGSESEDGGKGRRRGSEEEEGGKGRRKAERGSESEEGGGKVQRGSSATDEDSSSSSSAQDENSSPNPGSRRKKGKAPGSGGAGPAEEHPAVRRLKRYILACGVRRNYKKLLAGCRSVKQRVRVLRRELEAIGLQGNPSLERCRALRLRREEAAEVAALDVGNIIASDGRPRRCNIWSLYSKPPAAPPAAPPARRPVDWSSLRGVVSSDGESD